MRVLKIIIFGLLLLIINGCSTNSPNTSSIDKEKKVLSFSFIDAKVLEVFGNKIIVQIKDKDIVTGDSYEDRLTNKVVNNSLFIIGMKTFIGKENAIVSDIRRKQITFVVNNAKLKKNQNIRIFIPKKTIAVMDFSLIGMENRNLNKFAMEDITTKLVQSGQYVVVERTKLNTILKEHKLADSGLLSKESASKLGKLISADIILTGSFAKRGNKWKVNLRLIDVKTGVILTAIDDIIPLEDFRLERQKDVSNITEDFEDSNINIGWNLNIYNRGKAKSNGEIDKTTGAKGTNSSYKIDYYFGKIKSQTQLRNYRLRDISGYKGIGFFAKADKFTTLRIVLHDQNFDDLGTNKWFTFVNIPKSDEWRHYKVPFYNLAIGKGFARKNPGGDGKLDLDNIDRIQFELDGHENPLKKRCTLWLDEISFY